MTHIEKRRKAMEDVQKDVQALLRINEDRYSDYFYESGCKYLERLELEMKKDGTKAPQMWSLIKGSAHYWKWWRIQFDLKNQELVLGDNISDGQFLHAHYTSEVIIPKHVMNVIFPGS